MNDISRGRMKKEKRKILEVMFVNIGYGGIELVVQEILEQLESDMRVDCLTLRCCRNDGFRKSVEKRGGTLYELNIPSKLTKMNYYRALRQFFAEQENTYDVIHIHSSGIEELFVAAAAVGCNEKTTVIAHNHTVGSGILLRLLASLLRFAASFSLRRHVDYYCACSKSAAAWVYMPAYQRQANIIHNGVKTEQFRFDPARRKAVRQMLKVPSSDFVIGHVGRLKACKNQEFLIHILADVLKRRADSWLLLVGDGEDRRKLELLAKENAVDHRVLFAGNTSEVSDYMMAMDVFAFPSKNEGFGIAAVEAQASGLSVIASDCLPKEVKMTENVRFLPLVNNISEWTEAIISAQSVEREKGAEAVRKAGYDIQYTMEQIYQLYCTPAPEKEK